MSLGAQLAEAAIKSIRKLAFHYLQLDNSQVPDTFASLRFGINTYNDRRHSVFKHELSPCSAATRLQSGELKLLNTTSYQAPRPMPAEQKFWPGDLVRIRRVRNVFEHVDDEPAWSAQIYVVDSHQVLDGVNIYKIRNAATGHLMHDKQTDVTMQLNN